MSVFLSSCLAEFDKSGHSFFLKMLLHLSCSDLYGPPSQSSELALPTLLVVVALQGCFHGLCLHASSLGGRI